MITCHRTNADAESSAVACEDTRWCGQTT